jgi:hypothetical protein
MLTHFHMVLPMKESSFIICFTAYIEQRIVTKIIYIFLKIFETQKEGPSPYLTGTCINDLEIVEPQPFHSYLPAREDSETNTGDRNNT